MRIPYGYQLGSKSFIICREKAENIRMLFICYLLGASLGKIKDMLFEKKILSPTGHEKQSTSSYPMQSISQLLEPRHI